MPLVQRAPLTTRLSRDAAALQARLVARMEWRPAAVRGLSAWVTSLMARSGEAAVARLGARWVSRAFLHLPALSFPLRHRRSRGGGQAEEGAYQPLFGRPTTGPGQAPEPPPLAALGERVLERHAAGWTLLLHDVDDDADEALPGGAAPAEEEPAVGGLMPSAPIDEPHPLARALARAQATPMEPRAAGGLVGPAPLLLARSRPNAAPVGQAAVAPWLSDEPTPAPREPAAVVLARAAAMPLAEPDWPVPVAARFRQPRTLDTAPPVASERIASRGLEPVFVAGRVERDSDPLPMPVTPPVLPPMVPTTDLPSPTPPAVWEERAEPERPALFAWRPAHRAEPTASPVDAAAPESTRHPLTGGVLERRLPLIHPDPPTTVVPWRPSDVPPTAALASPLGHPGAPFLPTLTTQTTSLGHPGAPFLPRLVARAALAVPWSAGPGGAPARGEAAAERPVPLWTSDAVPFVVRAALAVPWSAGPGGAPASGEVATERPVPVWAPDTVPFVPRWLLSAGVGPTPGGLAAGSPAGILRRLDDAPTGGTAALLPTDPFAGAWHPERGAVALALNLVAAPSAAGAETAVGLADAPTLVTRMAAARPPDHAAWLAPVTGGLSRGSALVERAPVAVSDWSAMGDGPTAVRDSASGPAWLLPRAVAMSPGLRALARTAWPGAVADSVAMSPGLRALVQPGRMTVADDLAAREAMLRHFTPAGGGDDQAPGPFQDGGSAAGDDAAGEQTAAPAAPEIRYWHPAMSDRGASRFAVLPADGRPRRQDWAGGSVLRQALVPERAPAAIAWPPEVERRTVALERASESAGDALPEVVRTPFERLFRTSLADVTVHTDAAAAAATEAVGAAAMTVGSRVLFAPGRFRPEDSEGGALLAHELTHVVQQRTSPARMALKRLDGGSDATDHADEAPAEAMEMTVRQAGLPPAPSLTLARTPASARAVPSMSGADFVGGSYEGGAALGTDGAPALARIGSVTYSNELAGPVQRAVAIDELQSQVGEPTSRAAEGGAGLPTAGPQFRELVDRVYSVILDRLRHERERRGRWL